MGPVHIPKISLSSGTRIRPTRPQGTACLSALSMDAAERRLARVTAHLLPSSLPLASAPLLAPSPAAASSSPAGDSYRRVHGDVSSEPPEWRAATDEDGKGFVDIIYEKFVGEGIAKVKQSSPTNTPVKFWVPSKHRPANRSLCHTHTIRALHYCI